MKRCVTRANQAVFAAAQLKTGLSLRQIATRLGVSHAAVSFWRSGKAGASPQNARELAEVLGVPVTDLWGTRFLDSDGTLIPLPEAIASRTWVTPPAPEPVTFPGWDE